MPHQENATYKARVENVFSGDDITLMIDLGVDELHKRKRIRLHGVDTPNAVNAGPETEAGKLRTYVSNLLRGKVVELTVVSSGGNSWIGIISTTLNGTSFNLNDDLIAKGYKYKRET